MVVQHSDAGVSSTSAVVLLPGWTYTRREQRRGTKGRVQLSFANAATGQTASIRVEPGKTVIQLRASSSARPVISIAWRTGPSPAHDLQRHGAGAQRRAQLEQAAEAGAVDELDAGEVEPQPVARPRPAAVTAARSSPTVERSISPAAATVAVVPSREVRMLRSSSIRAGRVPARRRASTS